MLFRSGYEVGTYAVTDADGAIDEGKYVRIWRHGDGKWRLQHVTWNSNLALSAAEPESEGTQKTLYQRLGGYDVIAAIFDNIGSRVSDDPELSQFLRNIDEETGKRNREISMDVLCDLTGGPCSYIGRDAKMVHKELGITDEHWQSVLEYMDETLDELNIGNDEKKDFLAIIASLGGT